MRQHLEQIVEGIHDNNKFIDARSEFYMKTIEMHSEKKGSGGAVCDLLYVCGIASFSHVTALLLKIVAHTQNKYYVPRFFLMKIFELQSGLIFVSVLGWLSFDNRS